MTSPLKPLNGIQWNLRRSKISRSFTKFVLFRPISKQKWPTWPIPQKRWHIVLGCTICGPFGLLLIFCTLSIVLSLEWKVLIRWPRPWPLVYTWKTWTHICAWYHCSGLHNKPSWASCVDCLLILPVPNFGLAYYLVTFVIYRAWSTAVMCSLGWEPWV